MSEIIRLHGYGKEANSLRRFQTNMLGVEIDMTFDTNVPTQRYIFEIVCSKTIYEESAFLAMKEHLHPGDTFFDIGANCGWFSHIASAMVGESGAVHAWEPMDENVKALRRNAPRAIVHQAAVSDRVEEVAMFVNLDNDGGHALWPTGSHPHNEETRKAGQPFLNVKSEQLDSYRYLEPRAIKIDTEGAEVRVLRGAESLLRESSLKLIICEHNKFGLHHMGNTPEQVLEIVKRHGFTVANELNEKDVDNWIFTR